MDQTKQSAGQNSVVLTGVIGSGKTTFFNKICRSNQKTSAGGASVTQAVFSKGSAYGKGFRVLDTPGFGSDQKKITYACAIMCALSEGSVNQILLTVKAERTAQMYNVMKPLINGIYKKFKDLITVVVTFWDTITESKSEKEIESNMQEIINKVKTLNVNSVLFASKQSTGESICKQIDSILARSQARQLEITDTEFYANFDLIETAGEIETSLDEAKEKVTIKFRKIALTVSKFILDFNDKQPNMPEVMHALTVQIKQYANDMIEQFESENGQKFSELYESTCDINLSYLLHVELKKEIMNALNDIVEKAQRKMKVATGHFSQYIKKCPHCLQIWMKVQGCIYGTYCGKIPDDEESIFKQQKAPVTGMKFIFSEKDVILIEDASQPKTSTYQQNQPSIYSQPKLPKKDPIQQGCKKPFEWEKEGKNLSESEFQELFDAGIMDYVAKEVSEKEQKIKLKRDLIAEVEKEKKEMKIYVV